MNARKIINGKCLNVLSLVRNVPLKIAESPFPRTPFLRGLEGFSGLESVASSTTTSCSFTSGYSVVISLYLFATYSISGF
jgi:hypothetical protein